MNLLSEPQEFTVGPDTSSLLINLEITLLNIFGNFFSILFNVSDPQMLWCHSLWKICHLFHPWAKPLHNILRCRSIMARCRISGSTSSFYQRYSILLKAILFYQIIRCIKNVNIWVCSKTRNCVRGHLLSIVKPFNEHSECAVNLFWKERHRKSFDWFMPVKEHLKVYCMSVWLLFIRQMNKWNSTSPAVLVYLF